MDDGLSALLRQRIAAKGPLSLADYMAACQGDPRFGYYMTRDPMGRGGDFITAPEISQMFGELLGLWAVDNWHKMGRPTLLHLVELRPGRGTLAKDALRAAAGAPAFAAAATGGGATAHGPISQRAFLTVLGLPTRADRLAAGNPDQAAAVAAAQHRLIDPAEIGILFKVLALTSPGLATPAGFADPASAPAHNQRRPNP